jgi:hypothetical protein
VIAVSIKHKKLLEDRENEIANEQTFSRFGPGIWRLWLAAQPAGDADADSGAGLIERIDKHGDEELAGNTKAEAREWLKSESHVLFKANRKQAAQFVEDFYSAGAKQVLFVDIEEHEGKQFGEGLLVVLPTDAAARAKLFKLNETVGPVFQEDPVTDKGQKYLYFGLD